MRLFRAVMLLSLIVFSQVKYEVRKTEVSQPTEEKKTAAVNPLSLMMSNRVKRSFPKNKAGLSV